MSRSSRYDSRNVSSDGRVQPAVCTPECSWPNCTCHDEAFRSVKAKGDSAEPRSKYHREIKPGVFVDVYDVLQAWAVTNPALQHLVKKALQPGERGHKTLAQDMDDIVASAIRAKEMVG